MKKILLILIPLISFAVIINSCKKDVAPANNTTGTVTLSFAHYVNGSPVQLDTMIYTNEQEIIMKWMITGILFLMYSSINQMALL